MRRHIYHNIPLWLFLLTLVISLTYITFSPLPEIFCPDSYQYDSIGWNLAQRKGYIQPSDSLHRVPGYPIMLAGVYFLFGHNYFAVKVIQAILNALSCVMVYLTAQMLFGKRVAFLSGFLFALYPSFFIYSDILLSENLFIFLLIASVFVWLEAVYTSRIFLYALTGGLLALATLTRTVAVLIPILVGISILYLDRHKVIRKLAMLSLMFFLVHLPWVIHNYKEYNRYVFTVPGVGSSLWIGNYIPWEGKDFNEKGNCIIDQKEFSSIGKGLPIVDAEKRYMHEAIKNILSNPRAYVVLLFKKLYHMYVRPEGYGQLGNLGEAIFQKLIFLLLYLSILIFCMIGAFFCLKVKTKLWLIPFSVIVYITMIHILIQVIPRYHLPAMPFIIVMASFGFFQLFKIRNKQRINENSFIASAK